MHFSRLPLRCARLSLALALAVLVVNAPAQPSVGKVQAWSVATTVRADLVAQPVRVTLPLNDAAGQSATLEAALLPLESGLAIDGVLTTSGVKRDVWLTSAAGARGITGTHLNCAAKGPHGVGCVTYELRAGQAVFLVDK